MKKFLLVALCAVAFSSCATILSGSKKKVTLDSRVKTPMTLVVDGHRYHNVTFPCKVKVKCGFNDSLIRVEAEGYETQVVVIDKHFNPVTILNIFEPLGFIVDAVTGAMMTTEYEYYWVDLVPAQ